MMHIAGCRIERLEQAACKSWLDFVLGRGAAPMALDTPAWALCHCDDGVTWGRCEDGRWHLASSFFPEHCPAPSESNVLEIRVFSHEAEVLIWRTEKGLSGRVLRDIPVSDAQDPLRPDDEDRLLLFGRVIEQQEGFTRVGDGTGAEQVLPVRIPEEKSCEWPRLRVRHYFARNDRTGAVRVVATRLVEVK